MKKLLIFGASGYVGRHCLQHTGEKYDPTGVYRPPTRFGKLSLDFLDPDYELFLATLGSKQFDAVLFAQGINPRAGFQDITDLDFDEMLRINIITPTIILQKMKENNLASDANVFFLSSIAKEKGSYDPSYAAAKSAMVGLQRSLASSNRDMRFNILSLGLVGGSPVQTGMTSDFLDRHLTAMNGRLVDVSDICKTIDFLIDCKSVSTHDLKVDCGFRV